MAIEFVEKLLFDLRLDEFPPLDIHHLKSDNKTEWQKERCNLLEIQFQQPTNQHSTMARQKLRDFEPWKCTTIEGDGNCLFRCLSRVISESEEYHAKVRCEICRYMLCDGKYIIGWYFTQILLPLLLTTLTVHACTTMTSGGTNAELVTVLHYSRLISMLPTRFIKLRKA